MADREALREQVARRTFVAAVVHDVLAQAPELFVDVDQEPNRATKLLDAVMAILDQQEDAR